VEGDAGDWCSGALIGGMLVGTLEATQDAVKSSRRCKRVISACSLSLRSERASTVSLYARALVARALQSTVTLHLCLGNLWQVSQCRTSAAHSLLYAGMAKLRV